MRGRSQAVICSGMWGRWGPPVRTLVNIPYSIPPAFPPLHPCKHSTLTLALERPCASRALQDLSSLPLATSASLSILELARHSPFLGPVCESLLLPVMFLQRQLTGKCLNVTFTVQTGPATYLLLGLHSPYTPNLNLLNPAL